MTRPRPFSASRRVRHAAVAVLVAAALLLQGLPLSHAAEAVAVNAVAVNAGAESGVAEQVAGLAETIPPCHGAERSEGNDPDRPSGDEPAALCCASVICGMVVQFLPPEPAAVTFRNAAGFSLPATLPGPVAPAPEPRWRPPANQL